MLRVHDMAELGYGGTVTALAMWDKSRVEKGKIEAKDLHKKLSIWGYTIIGLGSLVSNVIDKPRGWSPYTERMMHGFIYDFPRVIATQVVPVLRGEAPDNPGGAGVGRQLLKSGQPAGIAGNKAGVKSALEF